MKTGSNERKLPSLAFALKGKQGAALRNMVGITANKQAEKPKTGLPRKSEQIFESSMSRMFKKGPQTQIKGLAMAKLK
jgi:hypothetical protein